MSETTDHSQRQESPVTIEELKLLCKESLDLQALIRQKEQEAEEMKGDLHKLKMKIKSVLERSNLEEFSFPGGVAQIKTEVKVSAPASDSSEKLKLLEYLRERNLLHMKFVNINARSLNTWYKQEAKIAAEEGKMLFIPGVKEPSEYKELKIK